MIQPSETQFVNSDPKLRGGGFSIRPTLFLCILMTCICAAQTAKVQGIVVDENREPLIGANVYLEGTVFGSATDGDGYFLIPNVPAGDYRLVISMISYKNQEQPVRVDDGRTTNLGSIQLVPTALAGDAVIVTAGKYEQRRQDVAASVTPIDAEALKYRNAVTLEDALQFVSGVNLTGGQLSVRGSTGYSRGAGSRVLFLIDGVPLLTGDSQDIIYEAVPPYLVDRVEVLKGAGSALYGSSAVGGVINVITKDIPTTQRLYARVYSGFYDKPSYDQWKWTDETRFMNGQMASYRNRFGNVGILLGGVHHQDDSFRRNDWVKRWTGSGKVAIDISSKQQLSITGNIVSQEKGNFLFWEDLDNALQPAPDQVNDISNRDGAYLTLNYQNFLAENRFLTVRGIYNWSRFEDNIDLGNKSTANSLYGEVQFNTRAGELFFTTGVEATRNAVNSNIFSGQDAGFTDQGSLGSAAYLQAEWNASEQWILTLGGRADYLDTDSLGSNSRINPKLGLVFKPVEGTAFRSGLGTGYRVPSISEAFASTSASGIRVIPNFKLSPEKSVYAELGLNQIIGTRLVFDAAVFFNRFDDFIEADFVNDPANPGSVLNIQFQNFPRTRVWGVEATVQGQFFDKFLIYGAGYTYLNATHLEDFTSGGLVLQRKISSGDFLDFRPKHIFYGDVRLNLQPIQIGMDYRYIGRYEQVNPLLSILVPDADVRVAAHVTDLRASGNFDVAGTPINASVQVNNIFQYNYIELPGTLAPVRNYVTTLEMGF